MFKESRIKIVVAIMSVLVLLFLGTLVVIYSSSYIEVSANNYKMLEQHAELYSLQQQKDDGNFYGEKDFPVEIPNEMNSIDEGMKGEPGVPRFEDTHAFQLSTFYSVAISDNGEILAIDNGDKEVYEEETLEAYALEIIENAKNRGTIDSLIYLKSEKNGYMLVVFMDNTIMRESITTLFRYTLIFGSIAIIAMFFVAVYLAKRIIRPLEEGYQKQKQFISDAGHELKTPVSVVSANAELLSRELGENQWLSNIQYENERMGKLVGQLLELARTENVSLCKENLDFSRLVAGETLPFESVAFEKGLILNCDIKDNVFIDGNSNQLKQLVSILVDNAIDHGGDGKEINLTLNMERNHAILSVVNAGKPIPAEQRELLFERFYRVDSARNGEDSHYGLGLAIAKAIVVAHKGKIKVSCNDGLVKFEVSIPTS